MSPVLFSIYAESMMKEAMDDIRTGIKVGGKLVRDVRFADDQGMVQEHMKININKTKTMRLSRNGGETVDILIEGQT